jgi:2-oxoglutarate dehydrogenase E2 component (dihydrolipoamide succinyltransferase)
MMYLALSYDHRVIDGKNSVGFLKAVKEYIENPAAMLFGTNDPEQILLEL